MKYRIESDFLGEIKIPSDAYYGIHTKRAVDNFPIADVAISVYPNIVIAYAMVKLACARANSQLGLLDDNPELVGGSESILDKLKLWNKIFRGKKPIYTTNSGTQIKVNPIGDEKSINLIKPF